MSPDSIGSGGQSARQGVLQRYDHLGRHGGLHIIKMLTDGQISLLFLFLVIRKLEQGRGKSFRLFDYESYTGIARLALAYPVGGVSHLSPSQHALTSSLSVRSIRLHDPNCGPHCLLRVRSDDQGHSLLQHCRDLFIRMSDTRHNLRESREELSSVMITVIDLPGKWEAYASLHPTRH